MRGTDTLVAEDDSPALHLGEGLASAKAVLAGEANELAARRPHPDAHLYDVEEGLRHRAERTGEILGEWFYE